MSLDLKCSRKGCKHRLKLSCDALTPSRELAHLATGQGWSWCRNGDAFCPEHQGVSNG